MTPWSPLGEALAAYEGGDRGAVLQVESDIGGLEEQPVSLFFRQVRDLVPVERRAVAESRGRVLDVGAAAGSVSLILQDAGLEVTALDPLPAAARVMRRRGVRRVVCGPLPACAPRGAFDTVLALMNGTGLAGTAAGLAPLLAALLDRAAPGGQVLIDSTDPSGWDEAGDGRAAGEIHVRLGFAGHWGPPFPYLFAPPATLRSAAESVGGVCDILDRQGDGRYLARIHRPGG